MHVAAISNLSLWEGRALPSRSDGTSLARIKDVKDGLDWGIEGQHDLFKNAIANAGLLHPLMCTARC